MHNCTSKDQAQSSKWANHGFDIIKFVGEAWNHIHDGHPDAVITTPSMPQDDQWATAAPTAQPPVAPPTPKQAAA